MTNNCTLTTEFISQQPISIVEDHPLAPVVEPNVVATKSLISAGYSVSLPQTVLLIKIVSKPQASNEPSLISSAAMDKFPKAKLTINSSEQIAVGVVSSAILK